MRSGNREKVVKINLKGGCTRFEVEHISCNFTTIVCRKNMVKSGGFFLENSIAADIQTSKHGQKSPNIGSYFRGLYWL